MVVRTRILNLLMILAMIQIISSCNGKKDKESTLSENNALNELSALIREGEADPDIYFERAKLFYAETAYDEAIDDLKKAQKVDSIRPDLYHLLADIYLDYYKSFEALKTMEKVVSLHPSRIPSLLKLAEFQYILKQYNESINTINNVLAVDRLEPEAFFMLGMNFRAMEDIERAKNAFQTAVENDPELIDAWIMLGSIYEQEEDPRALVYFDNALLIAPESLEALHAKAFYLQNHDGIQEAIDIYKNINILDPQYADAYLNAGLLYLELNSFELAFEQFNILVSNDITNPLGYFYRGYTHEQGGDLEKAKIDYEQALRLAPEFKEAREALELLLSKMP